MTCNLNSESDIVARNRKPYTRFAKKAGIESESFRTSPASRQGIIFSPSPLLGKIHGDKRKAKCVSAPRRPFFTPKGLQCGFFLLSSQKSHGLDSVSGPSSGEFRVGPSGVSTRVCVRAFTCRAT